MASTLISIPVHLSGVNPITGYTCPASKRAVIKQISVVNGLGTSGTYSATWVEANGVGMGLANGRYPLMVSGSLAAFEKKQVLSEFITIKAGDKIALQTANANQFTCLISIIEQDL